MALDMATGLVTSKLTGVVGDLEKGLGLDENSRDADSEKAQVERESQRKKEERSRHKDYIHDSREAQRQKLRNKYTLDSDVKGGSSKSSRAKKSSSSSALPPPSSQPTHGGEGGQDGDKKCVVS